MQRTLRAHFVMLRSCCFSAAELRLPTRRIAMSERSKSLDDDTPQARSRWAK
jgi:hypothetical protein